MIWNSCAGQKFGFIFFFNFKNRKTKDKGMTKPHVDGKFNELHSQAFER